MEMKKIGPEGGGGGGFGGVGMHPKCRLFYYVDQPLNYLLNNLLRIDYLLF